MDIQSLLKLTIEREASDLHIAPSYFPTLRINGNLLQVKTLSIVDGEISKNMIFSILTDDQKENLMVNRELDFGYEFESVRFRVNVYFTKGRIAASFRLISDVIRSVEQLGLPKIMHDFTNLNQGLILLTGPTGEGKSTTLAALIQEINLKYSKHILTVEDPIEYVYPSGKSIISQRELGSDTHSWTIALRAALREDPDVVLIGEMRDFDTIQAALTVAETGHLVFSTVHTNSAPETIDRIVDVFPPHQQNQIKIQLASELKAVISQRLVPLVSRNARTAACEVLINTPAVAQVIREGKPHLIDNIIQTSAADGMMLLETSLHDLYRSGQISKETAYTYAIRKREIMKLIEQTSASRVSRTANEIPIQSNS